MKFKKWLYGFLLVGMCFSLTELSIKRIEASTDQIVISKRPYDVDLYEYENQTVLLGEPEKVVHPEYAIGNLEFYFIDVNRLINSYVGKGNITIIFGFNESNFYDVYSSGEFEKVPQTYPLLFIGDVSDTTWVDLYRYPNVGYTYDEDCIDTLEYNGNQLNNDYFIYDPVEDYGYLKLELNNVLEENNYKVMLPRAFQESISDLRVWVKSQSEGPIIDGLKYYLSDYDHPVSMETIWSGIHAYDNVDGNITDRIIIEENNYYDPENGVDNRKIIERHRILFSVMDTAGNKSALTVLIVVHDISAPSLEGPDIIFCRTDVKMKDADILKQYTSQDNVQGNLTNDIKIESNMYNDSNFGKLGQYNLVLKVEDAYGNVTKKSVVLKVEDKLAPIINGPEEIIKSTSVTLTSNDILKRYTASDNLDGVVEVTILKDDYAGNGKKPGTYEITFQAVDSSGNIATKIGRLKVVDDEKPYYLVDSNFLNVSVYDNLTQEQIIAILRKIGKVDSKMTTYTILENTYEGMQSVPGVYSFRAKFKSTNGTEQETAIYLEVYKPEASEVLPQPNWLENLWQNLQEFGKWFVTGKWLNINVYYYFIGTGCFLILGGIVLYLRRKK